MSLKPSFIGIAALPFIALALPEAARADVPLHGIVRPEPFHSTHQEAFEQHVGAPLQPPPAALPPMMAPATSGPDVTVYGYWPYWGDSLTTLPYDSMSHVAIFAVTLNSDGSLSNTQYWTNYAATAVSLAHPYGVSVHLCVICFDSNVMTSVFPSSSKRAKAISQIQELIDSYGADGVNLDVEGLPSSQKSNFVTFVQELRPAVKELYLATPAVDWSGAYDYDMLAASSDGLFIMGYGYHYSGGDPGPIAPLFGGSPWGTYSLEWTVDDYETYGTPQDKIILGLPLYGYNWPTTNNNVPGDATGTGTAEVYTTAVADGERYGRHWDSVTYTPYTFPSSTSQLWYDDVYSLEDKLSWGLGRGIQGVGFWAVTYEDSDPTFWSMVDSLTTGQACTDADGDGISTCDGDCDDADASVHPEATELCDDLDNDCDGVADDAADVDGDGANMCVDCDDNDPGTSPLGDEIPRDGIDNDCDGEVDETQSPDCSGAQEAVRTRGHLAVAMAGLMSLALRRRRQLK